MATEFGKNTLKEYHYRRSLLEALLVSSVTEDNTKLSTVGEFILNDIISGTIDYIGGNAGQLDYSSIISVRNDFERCAFAHFREEMKAHAKGKLNPKVRKGITKLCTPYWTGPEEGPARPYQTIELYDHLGVFFGEFCSTITQTSCSIPQSVILRVRDKVIPLLSDRERKNIDGIGKAMRKYINRDLEFITKGMLVPADYSGRLYSF